MRTNLFASLSLVALMILVLPVVLSLSAGGPSYADNHETDLSALQAELQALQERLGAHEARLVALERQVGRLSGSRLTARQERAREQRPAKTNGDSWHQRAKWEKVEEAMSAGQVQAILGPPTKVEDLGAYLYWYYFAEKGAGSRDLSGHVVFRDGRVHLVGAPIF